MRGIERNSVVAGAFVVACVACRLSNQQFITRDELGDQWPFTVASGTVYCERQGNHVVFKAGGRDYAINESAKGAAAKNGYVAVDPILRPLPPEPVHMRVDRLPEGRRRDAFAEAVRCDSASTFGAVDCRAAILKNVDITREELEHIVKEGIALAWPPMRRHADVTPILIRGAALCDRR